ncbi:MAG: hypothetical protein CMH76_00430, partial [Nitrospinae bacterium]|nr:hypothetical protein [Nitrospinota bacterium]
MGITQKLLDHVHAIRYDSLPEEARDRAKYFLLDYLGVTLRACEAESSRVFHNFVKKRAPKEGPCTVVGTSLRTDAPSAATGTHWTSEEAWVGTRRPILEAHAL